MSEAGLPRRGVCLVLASAPGAGKTSISRRLLETEAALSLSVSATTRAPRPGEREGEHYFFRTPEQFAAMVCCSWRWPCHSMSNSTSRPAASASSTDARGVP